MWLANYFFSLDYILVNIRILTTAVHRSCFVLVKMVVCAALLTLLAYVGHIGNKHSRE